ncbi:MAG: DUF1643 domain-containing protein [Clostridia bacterium]|nr:DUF1643 domain-containing protein [Clostridia bacterium]
MRHVPSGDLTGFETSFHKGLERALQPHEDYDVNRWLFVPDRYTEFRYILGTRGEKPLICIGINPSTARPDALDRTLQSVERIALRNRFDAFLMFNLSAQRATDPRDMAAELPEALRTENAKAFRWALAQCAEPVVWAAWGTLVETRPYLRDCLADFAEAGAEARWVSFGPRSKKGHPHHPLYLRADTPMDDFDIGGYLKSLG